mmetsp:Transcript_49285/g.90918  ORF Transcript_49285/g.90918 Transcript_49285/m.90918 type:complete len:409 (-) Transcript_49285:125-1351(-)
MHLAPPVEAATLTEGANSIWEGMMEVMEEHFIPTVLASEYKRHRLMQERPCALRVRCKELVPWVRVCEVGDEHPSKRVPDPGAACHWQNESPTLAQWSAQWPRSQQPHACPQGAHKRRVSKAAWHPLLPEFLVALATCACVREVKVPLQCEQGTSVVETKEVDHRHQASSEQQPKRVDWEGELPVSPRPLEHPVLELLWIPTKLSLLEQIHGAGMMPVVLQDELFPWKREEITEGMRQVLLPRVRRECSAMHDIMIDIDVLDGQVGKRSSKCDRACPEVAWKASESCAICNDHQALCHKDERQDVPHVHHLLRGNLGEQERQFRWHGIGLVWCWEEASSLVASILAVLLHGEHLGVALHLGCVRIAFIGQDALHRSNLRIILKFLTELIKVLICTIKDRDSSTATSSS